MTAIDHKQGDSALALWSRPWPGKAVPLQLELGDLSVTILRLDHEWQLTHRWTRRGSDGPFSCAYLDSVPEMEGLLDRIAMETMSTEIAFRPRLADRPVVVRPYSPLTIPGRDKITLFVSTPLWLAIGFSQYLEKEFPLLQLSDTWMGSVAGRGELCYGSHTHARLAMEPLLKLPFRALTPITVHNKDREAFTLERLSIPAPFLSLYALDEQLVTEPITIAMDSERLQGTVEIGEAASPQLVSRPRKTADKGLLVNAWDNLFG